MTRQDVGVVGGIPLLLLALASAVLSLLREGSEKSTAVDLDGER